MDAAAQLHCPTCGARQAWSDACRRCKCDLSILHGVLRLQQRLRKDCLRQLHEGAHHTAGQTAGRLAEISPDEEAGRLAAMSHLAGRRFGDAVTAWSHLPPEARHSERQ